MTRIVSLLVAFLTLASPLRAQDLVVFAAASLKGPLDRIAADFGGVIVSYGGSGTLARQVGLGAPADVVLLANVQWMDYLVESEAVKPESVVDFVSNALVIVGQPDAPPIALTDEGLSAALGDGRLAMGLTESVPAGIYGREALTNLGLWEAVAPKIAEVDNVRAALALVMRAEAPLGIVYQSDAKVAPDLAIVARFPAESHAPIRYIGAVTAFTTHPKAQTFLDNLQSPAAQTLLEDAGFCTSGTAC